MTDMTLDRLSDRIRGWMFEDALPFWSEQGLDDAAGGYVERFEGAALTPYVERKRTRVIARQIYVFSHAHLLGFGEGLECARRGVAFLEKSAWLGDDKGWARVLERDGSVLDPTPDLYDQAFVIFALAWYARASGEQKALDLADRTLDAVELNYRSENGGFLHELPANGHRQQNPHMHLVEALLALHSTNAKTRYAQRAREIIVLFRTRFFDMKSQTLAEFFTSDWSRAEGGDGRITEPGHQFEWAWILNNAQNTVGMDLGDEARALVSFAEKYGVDQKTGVVYQQVRDDGVPIDRGSRVWPNTERLKAAVALFELDGVDPKPAFYQSAGLLFDRYLAKPKKGAWIEKFDEHGEALTSNTPASSFYHLFLGFSEVLRVSAAL